MPVFTSIFVTTYNVERTIEKTLESICAQLDSSMEVLIIDDGSTDSTLAKVRRFPVKVFSLPHEGRTHARLTAFREAQGTLLINIDADVLVEPQGIQKIISYFETHPEVQAGSASLSFHSLSSNFFTEYKHRYMHVIFSRTHERVSFLYGSLFAFRASLLDEALFNAMQHHWVNRADDTEIGQYLYHRGVTMVIFPELHATHLKEFTFCSLIDNDFNIPRDFGRLFVKGNGILEITTNHGSFAHASLIQVISIVLAYATLGAVFGGYTTPSVFFVFLWALCTAPFLYRISNKEILFCIKATLFTFCDHIVMGAGIIVGILEGIFLYLRTRQRLSKHL